MNFLLSDLFLALCGMKFAVARWACSVCNIVVIFTVFLYSEGVLSSFTLHVGET